MLTKLTLIPTIPTVSDSLDVKASAQLPLTYNGRYCPATVELMNMNLSKHWYKYTPTSPNEDGSLLFSSFCNESLLFSSFCKESLLFSSFCKESLLFSSFCKESLLF